VARSSISLQAAALDEDARLANQRLCILFGHSIDARAEGESEQRLYTLNAWAETPFFSDRERAAPAWREAVTNVSGDPRTRRSVPRSKKAFQRERNCRPDPRPAMINLWSRMAIRLRAVPGHYRAAVKSSAAS
jgi:hypothetical protein